MPTAYRFASRDSTGKCDEGMVGTVGDAQFAQNPFFPRGGKESAYWFVGQSISETLRHVSDVSLSYASGVSFPRQ